VEFFNSFLLRGGSSIVSYTGAAVGVCWVEELTIFFTAIMMIIRAIISTTEVTAMTGNITSTTGPSDEDEAPESPTYTQ